MKKIFLPLIPIIAAMQISFAQTTHLQWTATQISANAQANELVNFATDAQGNSFSINQTQDASSLYISNRLMSFDNAGMKKWDIQTDSCFTSCNEKYNCILPIGNGDVIFVGYKETTANVWEIILKKYLSNGTLDWAKYNTDSNAKPIKAILDNNQDIIVALDVDGIASGNDFTVAKYSKIDGSNIWHTSIADTANNGAELYETLSDIAVDNNNMVYGIGMASNTFANTFRLMVNKWDTSGAVVYNSILDNNMGFIDNINPKIIADNIGNLYTINNVVKKGILRKLADSNASLIFTKSIKKDTSITALVDINYINHQLYVLGNTSYLVFDGSVQGYHETNRIYFVNKIDTSATDIWMNEYLQAFDKSSNDKGFGGAKQMLNCGSQLLISSIQMKSDSGQPFYLVHKIDTTGNAVWYDSSKADVGRTILLGMDNNCNGYVNYDAFDGKQTLHGIVKKYTDVLNFPQSITQLAMQNLLVAYTNSNIEISSIDYKIISSKLININGQVIESSMPINHKIIIPQNYFAAGVYIVLLQTDAGAVRIKINLQ